LRQKKGTRVYSAGRCLSGVVAVVVDTRRMLLLTLLLLVLLTVLLQVLVWNRGRRR
jgi:Flp pilus assembly protein TadB